MRLIDADLLLNTGSGIKMIIPKNCHPYEAIKIQGKAFEDAVKNAPTVDAVEVVRITEIKQEILKVMDEFVAEWLGITQSYTDIFRAKIDAMEIAKRLVNAALNDLCDNGGVKMDAERRTDEECID